MEARPFQRVAYRVVNEKYCVKKHPFFKNMCLQYGTRTSARSKMVGYTKIVPVTKSKTGYECCKGWQNVGGDDCPVPICDPDCLNGGICVRPSTCRCRLGFFGDRCQLNLKSGGKNVCTGQMTYISSSVRPMTRVSTETYTAINCAEKWMGSFCLRWNTVTKTRTKIKSFTRIVYQTSKKSNGIPECCKGWKRAGNGECTVRLG